MYSVFSMPIIATHYDAISKAKEMASFYALERARNAGGFNLQVEMKLEEDIEYSRSALGEDKLVEMRVRARAVGAHLWTHDRGDPSKKCNDAKPESSPVFRIADDAPIEKNHC